MTLSLLGPTEKQIYVLESETVSFMVNEVGQLQLTAVL
jgi:hypothetical protein